MTGSFSIVIPTYRRPDALATTLDAVLRLEHSDGFEVIVVDDACNPNTEAVVRAAAGGSVSLRYECSPKDGAAAARNRGASVASGRWLLFCDDDIVPIRPDHLTAHLRAHESWPGSLVAGDWRYSPSVVETFQATPFGRFRLRLDEHFRSAIEETPLGGERFQIPFLSAANLSVERGLFDALGGFDEQFPFAGAEDQDLSLRARESGCTLVLDKSITVHHNDRWLSLLQYCLREERSAQTAVVLARNFPTIAGDRPLVADNAPIRRGDPARIVAKKAAKGILSRRPALAILHRTAALAERIRVSEARLARLYSALIGLHIFRGVRTALGR